MTAPEKDHHLKQLMAKSVALALSRHRFRDIPGLLSVETHAVDALTVQIRVRVDHGHTRGQMYHYYTVKVSEPT